MNDRKRIPIRAELDVLRAREARYATLVENSPYCIHEIDHEGCLASMNPAGLEMVGAADECEIVGIHYLDFVCDSDRPRIAKLLDAAFAGTFSECEFEAVNGRMIRTNFVPLPRRPDSTSCLMGISQDVTDRRHLEAELNQRRKLDAIGRLAGGVAHDFNNLLTVIFGASEMLQQSASDEQRDEVRQIQRAAERAAELTTQLLTFARRKLVRPTQLNLARHVADVKPFLRRILAENIEFAVDVVDSDLPILIDPGQLDQVLINLVANARDAMPEGGRLSIRVERVEIRVEDAPLFPALEPGPHARIQIDDTGPGILHEHREHVFEPFFTSRGGRGTGLGLATCHGILSQAQGGIRVEDADSGGARFVLHLPVVDRLVTTESAADDETLDASAKPVRILVVEDADGVRSVLVRSLRAEGHEVLEAADAETALEIAAENRAFDLLIADVVLPKMSGRELAEQLLERSPSLKVLYCSGYTDDVVLRHGVREANLHFLQKPYAPTDMLRMVAQVLASPD